MPPKRLRAIGHEDRLSVVDHLDELRSRLIVCAGTLIAAFIVCFIFNGQILSALDAPLHRLDKSAKDELRGTAADEVSARKHLLQAGTDFQLLARSPTMSQSDRIAVAAASQQITAAAKAFPAKTPGVDPITIGISEPFTISLKVAFYAALLLSLPLLLYEVFMFVVPALTQRERSVIQPILIAAPALFFAGVIFTYIVVLPAAIKFLQGYNSSHFNNLIQAGSTYSFEVLTMAAIGLAFEMPLFLLGLRAAGIISASTLTTHWRYAAVIIAIIGAAMPGADPVTTGLETAPLVILFLASIVLMKWLDRRAARREAAELTAPPGIGLER